jgi:hypothetical protein
MARHHTHRQPRAHRWSIPARQYRLYLHRRFVPGGLGATNAPDAAISPLLIRRVQRCNGRGPSRPHRDGDRLRRLASALSVHRLEPGIGHQVRALAGRIKRFAICGRPALRGVGNCAHCAGLLRLSRAPHNAFPVHVLSFWLGSYGDRLKEEDVELEGPRDRLSFGFATENRIVAPDHPNVNRRMAVRNSAAAFFSRRRCNRRRE